MGDYTNERDMEETGSCGALILVMAGGSVVEDCVFERNLGVEGGAAIVAGAEVSFVRCRFVGNRSVGVAGAVGGVAHVWYCIEELDSLNGNAILMHHTWQSFDVGLDVILATIDADGTSYFLHDVNKNVMQSIGVTSEQYIYSPFGTCLSLKSCHMGFSSEVYDIETNLNYYNYRYYSPCIIKKWIVRDPMDEQSELNLYLFAGNSPINIVDRLGWYTYNNAKSILRREKNWPSLADELWNLRIDCSMQQRFNEWIAREQDDLKWLDSIPDCPDKICVVDGKPKDCDNGLWDKFTEADQQYHKGAKWCMRSSTFFGPSQQCCYDGKGDLITDAHSGAGTPDRYAPTIINLLYLLHYIHDVDPYFVALDLDDKKTGINFDAYIGVRPPSQGGGSCYK